MYKELTDWLIKRAEEETQNVRSLQMSRLQYMFSSSDERSKNLQDAAKCLGKVEMIRETIAQILKECTPDKMITNDQIQS